MKRWFVALLLIVAGLAGCKGCNGCKKSGGDDGTKWPEAQEMLGAFTKPGADHAALTAALRPKPEDYDAVFVGEAAAKARAALDPIWDSGKLVLKPLPEQTDVQGLGVTGAQLAKGDSISRGCQGYKEIGDKIKPEVVIYCGRFVKHGEKGGLHINGLAFVNGHWALFQNAPRAFRAGRRGAENPPE
jgi:hypothetical protein